MSSEDTRSSKRDGSPTPTASASASASHRRPGSNPGLLYRFPFMRSSTDKEAEEEEPSPAQGRALATAAQQHKTRRRRGSLRKVALLGRGAQRDRRDNRPLTIDTEHAAQVFASKPDRLEPNAGIVEHDALGLQISDLAASTDGYGPREGLDSATSTIRPGPRPDRNAEQSHAYNSTTDEEDMVQIGSHAAAVPLRSGLSLSSGSGSESYYAKRATAQRRRSFQQAKSPLSYSGISTTALPPPDSWDYSETEWWGWVVLTVTWFVFVMGIGSCLDVWSWAWDVGKTPYAPPELEDDPTLPIVGYYPALIILTCVMAWVWVVVAWVGMKYFRHAKISGD